MLNIKWTAYLLKYAQTVQNWIENPIQTSSD